MLPNNTFNLTKIKHTGISKTRIVSLPVRNNHTTTTFLSLFLSLLLLLFPSAVVLVTILSSSSQVATDPMTNTRSNLVIPNLPVIPLPGRIAKKTSASLPTVIEESPPSDTTVAATKASAASNAKASATTPDDDDKIPATENGDGKDTDDDDDATDDDDDPADVNDDKPPKSAPASTKNINDDDFDDDDTPQKPAPTATKNDGDDDDAIDCSFIFESNTTCPELADELNGSYDLTFHSDKLYHHGVLTTSPTRSLRMILSTILETQATATGREALVPSSFDLFIPSRASVVNIITSVLTFRGFNGQAKCLLRGIHSLQQSLSLAMQSPSRTFYVYIPTKKLHLVDASGYFLPVDEWDPLNLGYFLVPNSFGTLNKRPANHLGDILPERSSVDHLAEVV